MLHNLGHLSTIREQQRHLGGPFLLRGVHLGENLIAQPCYLGVSHSRIGVLRRERRAVHQSHSHAVLVGELPLQPDIGVWPVN